MEMTNLEQLPKQKKGIQGMGNEEKGDRTFKVGILNLCS